MSDRGAAGKMQRRLGRAPGGGRLRPGASAASAGKVLWGQDRRDGGMHPGGSGNRSGAAVTASLLAMLLCAPGAALCPAAHAQDAPPPAPAPAPQETPAPAGQEPAAGTQQQTPPVGQGGTVVERNTSTTNAFRITVRDALTRQILPNAAVFLDDPTGSEFRKNAFTDASGVVIVGDLAAHEWQVTVIKTAFIINGELASFIPGKTSATIVDGQLTDVQVLLERRPPELIEILNQRLLIDPRDTANTTRRSLDFFRTFPVAIGNRESVADALRSVPGFVGNSLNQAHARGEQDGTALYVDGFHVPQFAQGRLVDTFPLQAVETVDQRRRGTLAPFDVKTGGMASEYGGETGAILNVRTRNVTTAPLVEGVITSGGYNSGQLFVNFGLNKPLSDRTNAEGIVNRAFSYMVHVNQRTTSNFAESPQPGDGGQQRANNKGYSNNIFGKFDLGLSDTSNLSGIISLNGGATGVANRMGLPDSFAGSRFPGQGYGFLGLQNEDRIIDGAPILSAQNSLLDIEQKESHNYSAIQYRNRSTPLYNPGGSFFGYRSEFTLQIGGAGSRIRLEDRSPRGDVRDLPSDSSVEYMPNTKQDYSTVTFQGDYTMRTSTHTIKAGFQYDDMEGNEFYQFIPGSQLALNNLYDLQQTYGLPTIVPRGSVRRDGQGQIVRDSLGNPIYDVAQDGTPTPIPTMVVNRTGYYGALYVQDTWRFTDAMTLNYGLRYDSYDQSGTTRGTAGGGRDLTSVSESEISPRLNIALLLPSRGILSFLHKTPTVLRASYNKLFERPLLGQGSFYGDLLKPQISEQWDVSIERQLDLSQVVKLALYSKDIENYVDVRGVLETPAAYLGSSPFTPGFQFNTGAVQAFSYPRARSAGFELTYQLISADRVNRDGTTRVLPTGQVDRNPLSAYVSYTNSTTEPLSNTATDVLGRAIPRYVDHDQRQTLSGGVGYTLADGTSVGVNLYYGSGLYSSIIPGREGRDSIFEVNLRASTSARAYGNAFGLEFAVENLFNANGRYNFQSPFEGTRFQQGRRLLASAFGRF